MRKPNFFVVGAAKSGTTALAHYLAQHPDVYVSPVKEPHHYATDLGVRLDPFLARHPEIYLPRGTTDTWSAAMAMVDPELPPTEQGYASLFAAAGAQHAVGEASTTYLVSRTAAAEIAARHPEARIVVILRNPVDMLHSLHAMLRQGVLEPIWDFADAWRASADRLDPEPQGLRVWLQYRRVAAFGEQLERYLAVLPREQVLVLWHDDLRTDPLGTTARALQHLGVEGHFEPTLERANPNRRARSVWLNRRLAHPPGALRAIADRPLVERLRVEAMRRNLRIVPRDPIDPMIADEVLVHYEDDIRHVERLTGRDLSSWFDRPRGGTR